MVWLAVCLLTASAAPWEAVSSLESTRPSSPAPETGSRPGPDLPSSESIPLPDAQPADTTGVGGRWSYWGPIPPPADSTTTIFEQPPRPSWATALLVPYRIVALPFWLVRHGAEKVIVYVDENESLNWLKRLLRPREGPFGVTVGLRAGTHSGIGGGVTATHNRMLGGDHQFKLRWHSTTRGSHKVSLGMAFDRSSANRFEFGGGYHVRPDARFFGIGYATEYSGEAHYTQETAWVGGAYLRNLGETFSAKLQVLYSSVGARAESYSRDDEEDDEDDEEEDDEDDDDISLAEWDPLPFGYRDRSAGWTVSLELMHDTTREDARPECGGIERIKVSRFWDQGDFGYASARGLAHNPQIRFWSFRAEIERFVPLWHRKRALAMRAYTNWLEPDKGTIMPFQRLLTNDDPDLWRGYDDMRWRDRGLVAMSIEYRWPLWNNMYVDGLGTDLYLFTDIGQVFAEYDEVAADRLTQSYGFGIRLLTKAGFQGLVELGWSEEDTQIRIKTGQIFQFQKGGLLHGRDQIALR